ncbi:F0F1 ATP synthase subunit A [Geobacter sulfurreducens]|uniref:ATP synthase subunit a n=1 Tax=Geobacter sulfurreducens (strain ATCC 51573 / DSM 12127 / PCA) TaxID=243231 RepID=ATP6_GEOSL|nr:F0F1 ATP synthase subunit A [Geobacter sulfurreducens]Q74GB2.1 RecName: Full=ATP synthase subunit a; AltName: Full=ATP synthase F0 sector subunit a; AltName: Full=F-ATPase subunit 6 [Geobacter sulfurreducens PCA]AAR33667.1 ATP synthase F0, A subunit [Geobacter sulfurreducens PCA]ADI83165.1 ATP synthase F0, A subunit [Geobacter sulfurreducens KN400]AJY70059.1 ATP synthase F0F1 subunit A [Geobacter sulfurreducens]QVW35594.1 F0F1 ATP synthase subunit A [Geobacter sulfurreducens]UAC04417.1 F0F
MVHPLLFLQFFRKLLEPLHISEAGADAIAYTWLIIVCLLIVSLIATKALKAVPTGMQNFMEVVIGGIENMVEETMGEKGKPYFPLIATLALFVLVSNLIGLIPGFFPPTANLNTTAACAVIVFLSTHIVGIKKHGFHYLQHFMGPIWWLAPLMFFIEIIGHLSRPLSLSLRLFGNMNGHELVLMIFFALAPFLVPLPMMLMGVLVSFIQAFVFMLLAMIYIQGSLEEAH